MGIEFKEVMGRAHPEDKPRGKRDGSQGLIYGSGHNPHPAKLSEMAMDGFSLNHKSGFGNKKAFRRQILLALIECRGPGELISPTYLWALAGKIANAEPKE